MDITEVKTEIDKKNKAIDERLEKMESQLKENHKGYDETLKNQVSNLLNDVEALKALKSSVEKLADQQDTLEAARKATALLAGNKSFSQDLTEQVKADKDNLEKILNRKSRSANYEIENGQDYLRQKVVGNVTLANVTGTMPAQFVDNFTAAPTRKVHIRSLIPTVPMTAATYSYPRYTQGEGTVGIQTEGSAKSQTDADIQYIVDTPIVIAHWQRHSEQILQDIPRLLSFVSGRMVEMLLDKEDSEILNGPGGANRLNGIITQATAYAPTGVANTANADRFSYLLNAISQLMQANYNPNGILVNPYAYFEMLQVKTTTKEYTAPLAGITWTDNTLRLAGIPLYPTTAMAANAFTVGDWMQAEFLTRQGIQVDISREDSDNFTKNLVTLRVEERVGLAVYDPAAFITGTWTGLAS